MEIYNKSNVLVTGSSGLAGHALVKKLLDAGSYVRATIHVNKIDISHPNLEVIECDLFNPSDCSSIVKDIDTVFHCAAYIRGAKGQLSQPMDIVKNNLYPTINIVEASCKNRVNRFGFISSSTIYPDVDFPVSEDIGFHGDPSKCYFGVGWMKRYCEKFCEFCQMNYDTKFGIIRCTALYGPYDNFRPEQCHVIPSLIMKICKKDNPLRIWGDGLQVRDFTYIDDAADALLKCVDRFPKAIPVNVASGSPVSIRDLVQTILEITGYRPNVQYDELMPSMIKVRKVDISRAKSVLNWAPLVGLSDGLERTIDWYRSGQCMTEIK